MDMQDWGVDPNFGMTPEHQCYVFRARGPEGDGKFRGFILHFPDGPRFYAASYEHETEAWFSTVPLTNSELKQVFGTHQFVEMVDGKLQNLPMVRFGDNGPYVA